MAVSECLPDGEWEESHRKRQWLPPEEAARQVDEPALRAHCSKLAARLRKRHVIPAIVFSAAIAHHSPLFAALPHPCSPPIEHRIAAELDVRPAQVNAAIALLDEGATVPFIARYRKEATDGLDDTQLRNLEERLAYLRDLEERRAAILASIEEQGKLTPELKAEIERCRNQAAPRRPLPAVQAEAPHQGADRPRSRHRAARPRRCLPTRP